MKVKDIVNNLELFKGCHCVTIKLDDYPYYIHSDEPRFDKYLDNNVKEIEAEPETNCSGPGTVYVRV